MPADVLVTDPPLKVLINRDPILLGARGWSLLSLITALVSQSVTDDERKQWMDRASEVLQAYHAKTEPGHRDRCISVLMLALKSRPEDGAGRTMSRFEALNTLCDSCFTVVSLDTTRFEQQAPRAPGVYNHGTVAVKETQDFARQTKEENPENVQGEQEEKPQTTSVESKAQTVPALEPVVSHSHTHNQSGATPIEEYMSWRMRSKEERKLLKRFKKPGTTPCLRCLKPGHGFKDSDAPCRAQIMAPFDKGKILNLLQESGYLPYASGMSRSSHTTTRTWTTSYAASHYRPFSSSSGMRSGRDTNTSYSQQQSVETQGFTVQPPSKTIWSSPGQGPIGGAILEGEHPRIAEHLCVPEKGNTTSSDPPLPTTTDLYQHDVDEDLGRIRDVPKNEIFIPDPESSSYCETRGDCTKPSVAQDQQEVKEKIIAGEFDELGCGRDISSEELVRLLLPKRTPVGERVRRSKTCAADEHDDLVDGGRYPARRNSG
jgi:hypothetical protein